MTGGNAGLATGAAVEGNLKGVLLAIAGFGQGDEAAVMIGEVGFALVVDIRKPRDGGLELFLLGQELVDEISLLDVRLRSVLQGGQTLEGGGHSLDNG